MIKDFHTEIFGDGIVTSLNFDFEKRETKLKVKQDATHEIIFKDIVWQEFSNFDINNIIFDIETTDSFHDFSERHKTFLESRKNYFPSELLQQLQKDNTLKYYFIGTSPGFDSFIICRDVSLSQTI